MMGITEVNPLPAHYRCPKCYHSIFNNDDGTALGATYSSGFDLPDKTCPKCNERLIKDGWVYKKGNKYWLTEKGQEIEWPQKGVE